MRRCRHRRRNDVDATHDAGQHRGRDRRTAGSGHAAGRDAGRAATTLIALLAFASVAAAAAPGWFSYRIKPGDSLWTLARAYGTTVEAIVGVNGLDGDVVVAGELLYLPGSRGDARTVPVDDVPVDDDTFSGYLVRRGDTLSAVAEAHGVGLAELARRNGLSSDMKIYVGQRLRIAALPAPGVGTDRTAASAIPVRLAGTSVEHVQTMIRAEAARRDVEASLALGIASVESGFDQSAVSGAGAVGVMQLMPTTARWVGELVGRPLDRRNTTDNIAGGVAFLRWLLDAADDESTAVASYYQGLHSVTHNGLYPDTRRYVAKVLDRRQDYR